MQFSLAHGAFQPQQQTIIESTRIVQTVLVKNQCIRECTQLKQPVPVGVVASQAGYFQPHHDTGISQAHLGNKLLEAIAAGIRCSGTTLITVDNSDLFTDPAQG